VRVAILSKALVHAAYRSKLDELTRLGVEVHAIVPHHFAGDVFEEDPNALFPIIKKRLCLANSHHLSFYPGLAKTLRAIEPDVFHIDEEPYNLVTYQALAATPTRRTVLFTWQNLDKNYPFPFSHFLAANLHKCQSVIAGSEAAARVVRRAGFRRTVEVIPQFGVDAAVYRKTQDRNRADLTVGFLGRLVPEKGIDLLSTATRGLPVRVLICGNGPLSGELQRQAGHDGTNFTLRTQVPSKDVPAVLNSLDVLVLPSRTTTRWAEQFGRVLIEAMACEVPVVGSTCGEIPNVIGDAGLLFREGDAEDLRARIVELTSNAELRATLGRRGRQRVLEHFTQKRIAEKTYDLYRSMLRAT
jgi:glycosyltransferase involved in cell wall biosynthesis